MRRSRLTFVLALGMTAVCAAFLPVWAAEETGKETESPSIDIAAGAAAPASTNQSSVDGCDDLVLEETGLIIGPGGRTCLSGGPPNDCDDYPVPQGGSCSCSSLLTQEECRECDSGKHGLVLETTCTICGTCYNPPCQITDCINRTSRICSL